MMSRLVLFGATGDLAARYLFPALASMHAAGRLPAGFAVTGAGRDALADEAFRARVADALETFAPEVAADSRAAVVAAARYAAVEIADAADVGRVLRAAGGNQPVGAYLALPPAVFARTIRSLAAAGLGEGDRIAIEKPFGTSLEEARSLNGLVAELFGEAAEQVIFRVDHVLGMTTLQDLIGLRLASRALDALWRNEAIERVEILWEEVLGLEGRAEFFDATGALKDVMQNHMLQVLAVAAMEPPASPAEHELHEAKAAALRAVRSPGPDGMAARTRRARYAAGTLPPSAGNQAARDVPAYADEEEVDPARETETLAELVVEVDTPRWKGTRFVLRGGKALAERRKGVLLRFRPADSRPVDGPPETLWIGIDGPDDVALRLAGATSDERTGTGHVVLAAPPPVAELPPYGNVLADFLGGGSRLAVRGDEAEEAWRIVAPVLEAWEVGLLPLEEYPAGATGFSPRG